ncbi:MAG TPA: response regulator [Anaerolineales bacterium]|nr:response regulator [Anaerolineales bacterium]
MIPNLKTILVVEDEPDTAEMFAEMIRLKGYQVLKCFGGAQAIAHLTTAKPTAVVLDVMMPDISGLEVLNFIRSNPLLADMPVIVISARGLNSDIKAGLEAGATVYLTKPVSYMDLIAAVENATPPAEQKTEGT